MKEYTNMQQSNTFESNQAHILFYYHTHKEKKKNLLSA